MSVTNKPTSRFNVEAQYLQYREYERAFWEWITEVVYASGLEGDGATAFIYQVGQALLTIDPAVVRERRG